MAYSGYSTKNLPSTGPFFTPSIDFGTEGVEVIKPIGPIKPRAGSAAAKIPLPEENVPDPKFYIQPVRRTIKSAIEFFLRIWRPKKSE